MKMNTFLSAVLGLVLFGSCLAQQRSPLKEWTANDYPNPQLTPEQCGRYQRSYVCDPDGLLTLKQAEILDWLLQGVHVNDTKCPCSSFKCETKKTGYIIAVALMRKLKVDSKEALNNDKMKAIRQFAFNLEQRKWNLGDCNEDIIIVYSAEDQVVYTMTGDTASDKISLRVIDSVTDQNQHYFLNNHHIYAGLRTMVMEYREALNGGFVFANQVDQSPKGSAVPVAATLLSTIISLLFCKMLVW